jgi:hypothetical protein
VGQMYFSYILRLWQTGCYEKSVWRATLEVGPGFDNGQMALTQAGEQPTLGVEPTPGAKPMPGEKNSGRLCMTTGNASASVRSL